MAAYSVAYIEAYTVRVLIILNIFKGSPQKFLKWNNEQ